MSAEEEVKTFTYSRADLVNAISPWANGVSLSVFDYLLHQTWDNKMRQPDNGPFLYPLDSIVKLMAPGKTKYQGVFCPSRSTAKRSPPKEEKEQKVLLPFSPEGFHFGKIPKNEVLFKVQHIKIGVTSDILLNNAPYERCHSLLITEISNQKPQIITYEGLVAALEVALLSTHPGIRLLFNSMGACGSVNQQHFQIYYTSTYQLPIDICDLKALVPGEENSPLGSIVFKTKEPADNAPKPSPEGTEAQEGAEGEKKAPAPASVPPPPTSAHPGLDLPAYVIKGINPTNLTQMATQLVQFTDFLVQENIPHNLCLCRDHSSGEIKVFIWARKFQTNRSYTDFNVASTELIGHCYYGSREMFDKHTEADIAEEMGKMRLDKQDEIKVEKQLATIFDPNSRGIFSTIFGWF